MARHRLTDRKLQALKRKGKRYDVMDTDVPGFGVRVSEIGQRTFILYLGRSLPWKPKPNTKSTRRISGPEARERARDWRELIQKGLEPKAEEDRLRRTELREQQTTSVISTSPLRTVMLSVRMNVCKVPFAEHSTFSHSTRAAEPAVYVNRYS